jgi:hypothetical protein
MANECDWHFQIYKATNEAKAVFEKMVSRLDSEDRLVSILDEEVWQKMGIPKWNFVQEHNTEDGWLQGISAWSPPLEIFAEITRKMSEVDPTACAVVTFADGTNFVGTASYLAGEQIRLLEFDEEDIIVYTIGQLQEEYGREPTEEEVDDMKWDYADSLVDTAIVEEQLEELCALVEKRKKQICD